MRLHVKCDFCRIHETAKGIQYAHKTKRELLYAMWDRVEKTIQMIRPALQAEGSDIELVGLTGGIVRLRLLEARDRCAMTAITMRTMVEKILKERVPEVIQVVAV